MLFQQWPVSDDARTYACRELLRRAGVSAEDLGKCRCHVGDGYTTIELWDGRSRARFPVSAPETLEGLTVNRLGWMLPPDPDTRSLIPQFIVPYAAGRQPEGAPLFRSSGEHAVECCVDLPLSSLLELSRAEEWTSSTRDSHGRFPATASQAFREGYLHRPIVDEYGLALEQAVRALLPRWEPRQRSLRVHLSHDVDTVGMPFSLREAVGHTVRRRNPLATVRDLLAPLTGLRPTMLKAVGTTADLSQRHGRSSAFYWKATPPGPFDTGYDVRHPAIQRVIRSLRDQGFEQGVHPGYATFDNPQELCAEVARLREALGDGPLGGRQHYLRWRPETWEHWEAAGLWYDSSVGYADRVGFRAGTCYPYRPWLLNQNREARLLELPLIVMDCSLTHYMGLSPAASREVLGEVIARCRCVGGVLTLLWHPNSLLDRDSAAIYRATLPALANVPSVDLSAAYPESGPS
jgi:hypothetical protein